MAIGAGGGRLRGADRGSVRECLGRDGKCLEARGEVNVC